VKKNTFNAESPAEKKSQIFGVLGELCVQTRARQTAMAWGYRLDLLNASASVRALFAAEACGRKDVSHDVGGLSFLSDPGSSAGIAT